MPFARDSTASGASGVRAAVRIAAVYLTASAAWILLSDRAVARIASDVVTLTQLQTLKGWMFVLLMAGLIFALTLRELRTRRAAEAGQRRGEARFRALLENIEDTVAVLDAAGALRYASPSIERLTGAPLRDRIGRPLLELVEPEDVPVARAALARVAETPGATATAGVRIRHAAGAPRYVEITLRNLLEDDAVAGIVVNARDQTARRQLEAEMRHAQKMEAVGRLAGGVAHDFNNVLTVILGSSETLLESLDADDPRRIEVEELQQATAHSRGMIRQLLAFSRRHPLELEDVPVDERIRETTRLLRATIPSRVAITLDLDAGAAWVRIGAGQLDQVLMNLAMNARDAIARRGEILVRTRIARLPAAERVGPLEGLPETCVRMTVSDTGHGIPAEIRERIFDPFFTTKPEGIGTGLGLSMVFGTVQQAGGVITCASQPGQGTTFEILLPLVEAPARPALAPQPKAAAPRALEGTERVLVVEDEPRVRALAARVLRRHGYTVLEASDGLEALDLLNRGGAVDIVVTDTHMPRMDGIELLERLPSRAPGTRALLISGDAQLDVPHPPATPFLEKPYTARVLATRVREVLDGVA